jgi:hypothetical protein
MSLFPSLAKCLIQKYKRVFWKEMPSVFTLKLSQTQAVLRFYDLDVCNTRYIVYFVFSNLQSTYLFWDVVARLHNRQVRHATVLFCNFMGRHSTVVLLKFLTWELLAKHPNLKWQYLIFLSLYNTRKGKPSLVTCLAHDWFPRTLRDKNPYCREIFARRITSLAPVMTFTSTPTAGIYTECRTRV